MDPVTAAPVSNSGLAGANANMKPGSPTIPPARVEQNDDFDPVAEWVDQGEFDPNAEPRAELPSDVPPLETEDSAPTTEEAPAEPATEPEAKVEPKTDDKPETKVVAKAEGETPAAEAAPAAKPAVVEPPKPATVDYTEPIALSATEQWTRGQIVEGLKERAALLPVRQEFEKLTGLFGLKTADEIAARWKPVIEKAIADPGLVALFDNLAADQEKRAYIDECSRYFDANPPEGYQPAASAAPAPAAPVLDAATQKRLEYLEKFAQEQEAVRAKAEFDSHIAEVQAKYPVLVNDRPLLSDLFQTTELIRRSDPTKTLVDVANMKASIYDAIRIARSQAAPAPAAVAAPQEPALVTTQGASPTATQRPAQRRPQKFSSADDATQAWLENPPAEFK